MLKIHDVSPEFTEDSGTTNPLARGITGLQVIHLLSFRGLSKDNALYILVSPLAFSLGASIQGESIASVGILPRLLCAYTTPQSLYFDFRRLP